MERLVRLYCCIFSIAFGFATRTALMLMLGFAFHPEEVRAQGQATADLQQFAGTYHALGSQGLTLEISISGKQLLVKESWSKREIRFDQKAELNFTGAADPNFTLDFARDKSGAINQVTAFKEDLWLKARPEPTKLSPAEAALRVKAYKAIISAFAAAVNSNTTSRIQEFIQAYMDPVVLAAITGQRLAYQVKNVYRSTGGIDLYTQKPFQPESGSAVFKGRSLGNLYQVSFALNPEGKIINYGFLNLREFAPAKKPVGEPISRESLEMALKDLAAKDIFSGTVLFAKGNKVLFRFAAGEANKRSHAQNTLDTRFNLGSMNKMFTATSIMQLAEKGLLGLEEPIGKYLDTTWLPRAISEKVTVRQLISHTSGIQDPFWEFFKNSPRIRFRQLEGYKPFTRNLTLAAEPGAAWSYNNTGMLLAGAIVQQVSGLNYFDYVRRHIYQPSGMAHTNVLEIDDKPEQVAIGYILQDDGSYRDNINMPFTLGSPAGGGYSTVEDLYRFAMALNAGKLVSAASRTEMFTDHKGREYGYGFEVRQTPAGKMIGHGGGAPGINAVIYILPESGYVVAVMANYDRSVLLVGDYLLSHIQALPTSKPGK